MTRPSEHPTLSLRGKRALVTGGAGFIGSHLARALLDSGAEVTIIDDLSTGNADNVPAGARLVRASILDDHALRLAAAGADYFFHLAAMVSVPASVENPDECIARNVVGTQRVLSAAVACGAKRVVIASSAAAYGAEPSLPSRETDPVDPRSPYAASKLASELLGKSAGACWGLPVVSLRFFNVYGPRQNPRSPYAAAICAFLDRLRSGRRLTIFGDGAQTRDFVFVGDVVRANLLAATHPGVKGGEVVNIGTGHRSTLLDVAHFLAEALGTRAEIEFAPARPGDVRDSVADISRARTLLGFKPLVGLRDGMRALAREEATRS